MDVEEWAKGLTKEQADGLGSCKTPQEAVTYCRENGLALPDELLQGVAGGNFWGNIWDLGKLVLTGKPPTTD